MVSIDDVIKIKDILLDPNFQKNRFLSDLKKQECKAFAYVISADLCECRDYDYSDLHIQESGLMEAWPSVVYDSHMTSRPVESFLKVEDPYLPPYIDDGYFYDTKPKEIAFEEFFILRTDLQKYVVVENNLPKKSENVSQDCFYTNDDWSLIDVNGHIYPLNKDQAKIVKYLHEANTTVSSDDIRKIPDLKGIGCSPSNGKIALASIFKVRDSSQKSQRDLIEFLKNPPGHYRISTLLRGKIRHPLSSQT